MNREKLKRKPGRPTLVDSAENEVREILIDAAEDVYAEHGYHDCTVAMILDASGVSRPTFYRYFKNKDEVIGAVIDGINQKLIDKIVERVGSAQNIVDIFDIGVDAYFEWGDEIGKIAGSIYREMQDAQSPASRHREATIGDIVDLMEKNSELEKDETHSIIFDALIHVTEHIGHQAFWPNKKNKKQTLVLKTSIMSITRSTLNQLSAERE